MLAGLDLSIDAPDSVTQMPSVASANNGQGAFQTGMQLRQLHIAPQTVFDALCVQPSRVADGLPDVDAAEAQRTWGRYWSGATSPRHPTPIVLNPVIRTIRIFYMESLCCPSPLLPPPPAATTGAAGAALRDKCRCFTR